MSAYSERERIAREAFLAKWGVKSVEEYEEKYNHCRDT